MQSPRPQLTLRLSPPPAPHPLSSLQHSVPPQAHSAVPLSPPPPTSSRAVHRLALLWSLPGICIHHLILHMLSLLPTKGRRGRQLFPGCPLPCRFQENILYNIPATSASLAAIETLARRRVRCVSLTSLDSSTVSRDVIQAVSCHLGPHLQSLCLRGSSLTETAFVHLLLACPRLSSLDLSGCNSLFMSGTLLSKPETISQARRALTNLQDNYNSSALLSFRNLLRFLKERASNLRALDLSGTSITSPAMRALVQVEGLRLRELVLQNCSDLSNEAIGLLCTHQPHLTVLDLTGCSELSDRAALAVSAGLRALQSLGLGKLQRLTDGGFLGIAELRSLQRLDLSECSLVSGSELVKVCSTPELRPSLASLSFAFCSLLRELTDWGLLGVEEPREERNHRREVRARSGAWLMPVE
uniref:Leucine rich repeat containing 29 n=1 Tax=Terrapene triunguis TaxID=2587831 RepID=A0A674IHH9_9SAUR